MNFSPLAEAPRLLVEATLQPLQGDRFQPTGFPDLGPALYTAPGARGQALIVESAQSMANRLEEVCWDATTEDWLEPLHGLPFVKVVNADDGVLTNSLLEAHRLNSPYILESKDPFVDVLKAELASEGAADLGKLARTLLKYDPNSLIHGVFLAKKDIAGGRLRLPRALTSFVEASAVTTVASGGVKVDRVDPKDQGEGKSAKEGFGNVPFHREEFCGEITAYFNVDLEQLRGYRLGEPASDLLTALALFKIVRWCGRPFRPRTFCDLEVTTVEVKRPDGYTLPELGTIEEGLPGLVEGCVNQFANPRVTRVTFKG